MAWPALLGAGIGWRLVTALINGVRVLMLSRLGLFLVTAIAWMGLNLGTINLVVEPTVAQLESFAAGGGGGGEYFELAKQWAGVLNFDKALTMVISAVITKHAVMKGRLFLFKQGIGAK